VPILDRRCARMTTRWTVTGWPVHQADWKREILRSEWLVLDEGWE